MVAKPLRIAIAGAGRMGQAIAAMIDEYKDLSLAGTWSRGGNLDAIAANADVIVDFSLPEATPEVVRVALALNLPLVCGVTGQGDEELAALHEAARSVPVVHARNMSQGIALLGEIISRLGSRLGPEFEGRIEETHHTRKKDAPSGTAIDLRTDLAAARALDQSDIQVASERKGDVIGDHSVVFDSPLETLTIVHSAKSRDVFAEGAIKAARWIALGRVPGLYSMRHVLGIHD